MKKIKPEIFFSIASVIAGTLFIVVGLVLAGLDFTTAGVAVRIFGNIFTCMGIVWAIMHLGIRK